MGHFSKKKGSILGVIVTKGSILWVMFSKKDPFIRVIYFEKVKIFFKSHWKWVQFLWAMLKRKGRPCWKEGFNSASHIFQNSSILWPMFSKGFNSLSTIFKKYWILWVIFSRCSILWVIFSKKKKSVQFFES